MTQLSRYSMAKKAMSEYKTIDEVLEVRDKSMAIRMYAQQAQDRELEKEAIEARFRAERRLGEMLREGKEDRAKGIIESHPGVFQKPPETKPILADLGIDKNLAHRARRLASMPEDKFENTVTKAREFSSVALVSRADEFEKVLHGLNHYSLARLIIELRGCQLDGVSMDSLHEFRGACLKAISRVDSQIDSIRQNWENVTCLNSKKLT